MEHREAHAKCGGVVAFLEGRLGLEIPDDIISASTLTALEKRLRRLEAQSSLLPPPAGLDATWETVALRIYRVQKADAVRIPKPVTLGAPNGFLELMPAPCDTSVETLQTMCAELRSPTLPIVPWRKYANDDDALDEVRQRLCHAAGQRGVALRSVPYSRTDIYATLVELAVRPVHKAPITIPVPIPPFAARKSSCCGCCRCSSHGACKSKASASTTARRRAAEEKRRRRGLRGFIGRLAFWRQRRGVIDDSSSSDSD